MARPWPATVAAVADTAVAAADTAVAQPAAKAVPRPVDMAAVTQAEWNSDSLASLLQRLLDDGPALALAAERARGFGRRDAVEQLARLALTLEADGAVQGRAA